MGWDLDAAGATDTGLLRETNQDHFVVADLTKRLQVEASNLTEKPPGDRCGKLLLVADGMGGVAGGELASSIAARELLDFVTEEVPWFWTGAPDGIAYEQTLAQALCKGHGEILERSVGSEFEGMGTTATLALVVWPELFLAHAGDSRAYLVRAGTIHQLTHDDTVAQQLVDQGRLSPDEARRSRFGNVLTQVLGGRSDGLDPQVLHLQLEHDDLLVLCSDGVTNELTDGEIFDLASRATDSQSFCDAIVEAARTAGGRDNITVAAASCRRSHDHPLLGANSDDDDHTTVVVALRRATDGPEEGR